MRPVVNEDAMRNMLDSEKRTKGGGINPSGEDVTRFEIFCLIDIFSVDCTNELSHIPEEIFLKDSLTNDAEFSTQCIES